MIRRVEFCIGIQRLACRATSASAQLLIIDRNQADMRFEQGNVADSFSHFTQKCNRITGLTL